MNGNVLAFSATAVGYNHIKTGKVCEDASDWYADEQMKICIVADGHGSDNYPRTDRGAKFAVEAAKSCMIEFVKFAEYGEVLNDEKNHFRLMLQLAASILNRWHQAVADDYETYPFTEEELEKVSEKYKQRYLAAEVGKRRFEKAYGCTLIAYAVTEHYSFGVQIGDGKCVHVDRKGTFSEPIPWDEDCRMNVTTSICDDNAIEEFRFTISEQPPLAVFCGSDGIDDSYAASEELYAFYRAIIKIYIERGMEAVKTEITEYLPVLSQKGSGDDVSIGLLLDCQGIREMAPLFEMQMKLFDLTYGLKEKIHKSNVMKEKETVLRKKIESGKEFSEIMELVNKYEELKMKQDEITIEIEEATKKQSVLDEEIQSFYLNNTYCE